MKELSELDMEVEMLKSTPEEEIILIDYQLNIELMCIMDLMVNFNIVSERKTGQLSWLKLKKRY